MAWFILPALVKRSALSMLVLLAILVFVYHLGIGIYYARGVEPSPTFEFLYTSAFLCGIVWWLRAEGRKYSISPVYCAGLLVGIGWPIIIPYHLLKTRGVRGLIPLMGLIGALLAAYLLAILIYIGLN